MVAIASRLLPPARGVKVTSKKIGRRPVLCFEADKDRSPGVILYLHGGGYVLGSPATHSNIAARLARLSGLTVVVPDYRLAPEGRWPAARDDACQAWSWLRKNGNAPGQIALIGDSAGGGMAVAVAQHALGDTGETPAALVCFSPWVDLTLSGATIDSMAKADPLLSPEWLAWAARTYLGGHPAEHPLASPLFGEFEGLPPMMIHVGGREILLDDAIRLADAARAAGVAVRLEIEPALWHVWQAFAGVLPAADVALARAAEFVLEQMAPATESRRSA